MTWQPQAAQFDPLRPLDHVTPPLRRSIAERHQALRNARRNGTGAEVEAAKARLRGVLESARLDRAGDWHADQLTRQAAQMGRWALGNYATPYEQA